MRITDIKSQKRYKNRFSIYVDGKYGFSLDSNTLSRAGVYVGEEIDEKGIEKLILKDEYARAREYGFLLLSYRDRSEYEFRERLIQKEFHRETVREIVDYFKKKCLVDDAVFARKWLENTLSRRPVGRIRVIYELRQKKVCEDVIEKTVEEMLDFNTESELARKAALKKMDTLSSYPENVARRRLAQFMRNRGFQFAIIRELMKEYFSDDIS